MSRRPLNLAARPFLNTRPVRRVTLLLWIAGGLFFAANLALYWQHFTGFEDSRVELADLEARIAAEGERIRRLEAELGELDLEWQNEQVEFLNARIAERTFPWSRLFDHLAEVLPNEVRLFRLSPRVASERRSRGRARGATQVPERMFLGIDGAARSGEALFAFVDAMFAHPSFERPNPTSEATADSGVLAFRLDVTYLREAGAGAAETEGGTGTATAAAAGDEPPTAQDEGGTT